MPRIQNMLAKVNKRCRRLHIPEIVFNVTGSETRVSTKVVYDNFLPTDVARMEGGKTRTITTIFNHVEVSGEASQLGVRSHTGA